MNNKIDNFLLFSEDINYVGFDTGLLLKEMLNEKLENEIRYLTNEEEKDRELLPPTC